MEFFNRMQTFTNQNRCELSKDYFLVGDLRSIGLCVIAYLYMCIYGPRYMQHRKEIANLKPIIQVYNILMVATNAYITYELFATVLPLGCSWLCEPASWEINARNTRHARALWIYYISKIVEYADTGFFIARKKFSHVSFLHVYHHASMSVIMWVILTFFPVGDAFVAVVYNSIIHVIMYSYYFLSALGPQFQKYLWWKRHLTKMQIIQFCLVIQQSVSALWMACNPNHGFIYYIVIAYMISFIFLFTNFYLATYIKGRKKDQEKKAEKKKEN